MAERYPDRLFIGIERQADRVLRCQRKIDRLGLKNTFVIQGELPAALGTGFPLASLDVVHVLFPDPWPKRRHEGRRLVQPAFLDRLAPLLKPSGRVRLMTDDGPYFAQMRLVALERCGWIEVDDEPEENFAPTEFQGHFHAKGVRYDKLVVTPPEKIATASS